LRQQLVPVAERSVTSVSLSDDNVARPEYKDRAAMRRARHPQHAEPPPRRPQERPSHPPAPVVAPNESSLALSGTAVSFTFRRRSAHVVRVAPIRSLLTSEHTQLTVAQHSCKCTGRTRFCTRKAARIEQYWASASAQARLDSRHRSGARRGCARGASHGRTITSPCGPRGWFSEFGERREREQW